MVRQNHMFVGKHAFAELYGIDPNILNDTDLFEKLLKKGISLSRATLCGLQKKNIRTPGYNGGSDIIRVSCLHSYLSGDRVSVRRCVYLWDHL